MYPIYIPVRCTLGLLYLTTSTKITGRCPFAINYLYILCFRYGVPLLFVVRQ
jgi:hypothetical protein